MRHGNRLMRGPVILGVMDVKHADRDNLRTLTAMIDTPVHPGNWRTIAEVLAASSSKFAGSGATAS